MNEPQEREVTPAVEPGRSVRAGANEFCPRASHGASDTKRQMSTADRRTAVALIRGLGLNVMIFGRSELGARASLPAKACSSTLPKIRFNSSLRV